MWQACQGLNHVPFHVTRSFSSYFLSPPMTKLLNHCLKEKCLPGVRCALIAIILSPHQPPQCQQQTF